MFLYEIWSNILNILYTTITQTDWRFLHSLALKYPANIVHRNENAAKIILIGPDTVSNHIPNYNLLALKLPKKWLKWHCALWCHETFHSFWYLLFVILWWVKSNIFEAAKMCLYEWHFCSDLSLYVEIWLMNRLDICIAVIYIFLRQYKY